MKINKGFTLIELLLTISVLALIGFLSVPFYSRFLTQNAVGNTTDQLVMDLRKAQLYALTSRKSNSLNWGVSVNNTTKKIILYHGNSFASRNTAFDEAFNINGNISISPGSADLNFSRLSGLPNSSALISITGNSQTSTVTINSQGMVTR